MPVTTRKMDKENNVRSVRKAKAAPDFSKLHKQWDAKLQKGKAVVKKPLTDVQPFQLTQTQTLISSSDNGFQIDLSAKESILNGEGIIQNNSRNQRSTISHVRRVSTKSLIPRASFRVQQRSSLYTKTQNIQNRIKNKDTSLNCSNVLDCTILESSKTNSCSVPVSRPTVITDSPSIENAERLQGFHVNFKSDPNALNSIVNGTGIPLPTIFASKVSSQFGPEKKSRVKGRAVPFQKPPSKFIGRVSHSKVPTTSINTNAKQRWSIYSRDSFSTKPDLMTWLKQIIDDGKNKNCNSVYKRGGNLSVSSTSTSSLSTTVSPAPSSNLLNTVSTGPSLLTSSSVLNPKTENTKVVLADIDEATQHISVDASNSSYRFNKTVVGFQGDSPSSTDNTIYTTPEKLNKLSTLVSGTSAVKSILKKKACSAVVEKDQAAVVKTPSKSTTTPVKVGTPSIKTPVRFSAYARNQRLLGLPLPKENRYETMGECITKPKSPQERPSSKPKVSSTQPSAVKHVRWADGSKSSLEKASKQGLTCASTSKTISENLSSINHNAPTVTPGTSKAKNQLSYRENSPSVIKAKRPVSVHQIKYVMPAEQPLEKTTKIPSDSIIKTKNKEKTKLDAGNESWASILSRDIDGNNKVELSTVKRWSVSRSLNDKFNVTDKTIDREVKVSKKKHRNSILERIYGPLDNDLDTSRDESVSDNLKKKAVKKSRKKFRNSTLDRLYGNHDESDELLDATLVNRPVPALDKSVIEDLIRFHSSDEEDSPIVEIKEVTSSSIVPLQSTMLLTPLRSNNVEQSPLFGFTPLNTTVTEIPEAPCKQQTYARTPYKQEMLDHLERVLNASRKANEDTLNCTVSSEVIVNEAREKHLQVQLSCNENINEVCNNFGKQVHSLNTHVDNLNKQLDSMDKDVDSSNKEIRLLNSNLKTEMAFPAKTKNVFHELKSQKLELCNRQSPVSKPESSVKPSLLLQDQNRFVIQGSISGPLITSGDVTELKNGGSMAEETSRDDKIKMSEFANEESNEKNITCHQENQTHNTLQTSLPSVKTSCNHDNCNQQTIVEHSNISFGNIKNILSPSMKKFPVHNATTFATYSKSNNVKTFGDKEFESILKPSKLQTTQCTYPVSSAAHCTYPVSSAASLLHQHVFGQNQLLHSMPTLTQTASTVMFADADKTKQKFVAPHRSLSESTSNSISKPAKLFSNQFDNTSKLNTEKNIETVLTSSVISLPKQSVTATDTCINETGNESMFDEDVCLVFSKPMQCTKNSVEQQTQYNPSTIKHLQENISTTVQSGLLEVKQNNPVIGIGSAFKRVSAKCNIFPKVHSPAQFSVETSKEMKNLNMITNQSGEEQQFVSVLDAEISLCSKFAEISERFGKKVYGCRDGAKNIVAMLLTEGDEKHFVPVTVP